MLFARKVLRDDILSGMAKKNKLTTKPTPKPLIVQKSEGSTMPATAPSNKPPSEGRIQKAVQRLADSFVDWVLDNFWTGVFLAMASVVTLIWLYMHGGGAAWVYPYFNFALGFFCACITLVLTSLFVSYIKARRLKQEKHLKFVSQKKGLLDHQVNIDKARNETDKVLLAITKELQEVRKISDKGTAKGEAAAGDVAKRHKLASGMAAQLTKSAVRMEQHVIKLEKAVQPLSESTEGVTQWLLSKQAPSREELIAARGNFIKQIEEVEPVLSTIETYRNTQLKLADMEVSQDLNTAMNRLSSGTDDIIKVLQNYKDSRTEVIRMIDRNL
jgi:hypothetical protein